MNSISRRLLLKLTPLLFWRGSTTSLLAASEPPGPVFGTRFPNLDSLSNGEWWKVLPPKNNPPPSLKVPRDEVVAFALYTHDRGVLKLTAQLFPLMPGEAREVRLELQRNGEWQEAAKAEVVVPGWSAHFRIENWDNTQDVPYRVRHGGEAMFDGLIRRDPVDKEEIVIANMSCNSSRTGGMRPEIVEHLLHHDPDVLFFAGDQTYRETEHTAGWLEFGLQFRDVIRNRPTICTPDDHDIGQGNLWGENGRQSKTRAGADGGYFFPADYVNMVQRQQSWSLPDPYDPTPVERGITVYYTNLRVGGVDFAILEDRKFKSGPDGKIPKMGPRPDHINDPSYDPGSIDVAGLELLGKRQEKFLHEWGQDWSGAEMKVVLSQTAFCGAVHMHGGPKNRLLADLDCNGWPQTPRKRALEEIRRCWAVHLCGDQHLAVVTKQGIEDFGDGPYEFTSPALVNTIYGRWWHPLDEKAGSNPVPGSPHPWTGDFRDGLGNKISMLTYANPPDISDEKQRGDGYGVVRFNKKKRTIRFECWPRFSDAKAGDSGQFPGWPVTVPMAGNDGRKVAGYLPEFTFDGLDNPVVQVIEESSGEILYTVRIQGNRFQPQVYSAGSHTLRAGKDRPDAIEKTGLAATTRDEAGKQTLTV
ncbi:hypothetical protein [Luteolibacter marinus]|uniref:hypothetical protein n=1 Tax=Luteolibacter marinus TaxID=2776705 RepID=UPI0018661838|nr:hypothetical protein [Luteolibacter marinus]